MPTDLDRAAPAEPLSPGEPDGVTAVRLAWLTLGLIACASSVIFIKLSQLDPVRLCALRLGVAVIVLAPFFLRDLRRHRASVGAGELRRALLPGAVLGVHFISWVIGARMTPAVNSSLIVNMVPAVTPLLLWVLAGEWVGRREGLGTGVALAGVLLLGGSDLSLSAEFVAGDAVCFGSMILFALYLVLARRNRGLPSLWLYVVPLYACAGVLCAGVSAALEGPLFAPLPMRELALAVGLGLVPTVVGHSILNHTMQHVRGQVVGVANLSQPLFAGIMAWVWLQEVPQSASYLAGGFVLVGVILVIRGADGALDGGVAKDVGAR